MEHLISLLGFFVFIAIAWGLSQNRWRVNLRTVISGIVLQFVLAAVFLFPIIREWAFAGARNCAETLNGYAMQGAEFVFGKDICESQPVFILILPIIIFFSSLTAVLFYLGILQWATKIGAWVMKAVLGISGSESVCTAANVFLGMTTAPLTIRPYLKTMTRSELMLLLTGGMATSAGGTMIAYTSFGADAGHLIVASILSAPAAVVVAKIMNPETEDSPTLGRVKIDIPQQADGVIDAACRGASEGVRLAINIAAMLIAFVALVALLNGLLSVIGPVGGAPLTWERILGWAFYPLAWLLGVPGQDVYTVGQLLGTKTVLNEFFAYGAMQPMLPGAETVQGVHQLTPRGAAITTYALCGFANFGSIAVLIGGLGTLIPERQKDLAQLGLRSMIAGTLATLMTAAMAGIFL